MTQLSKFEAERLAKAAHLVEHHSGAISGFARHTIETVAARFAAQGRKTDVSHREWGIIDAAIEHMERAAEGLPAKV